MKIKWTNKFSNESGYVKYIDYPKRHFVNTFNKDEARSFKSAQSQIDKLIEYGEAVNNDFIVVDD